MRKSVFGVHANSKYLGQPAEIYSLIRNFAILYVSAVPSDSIRGQGMPWSDCKDVQADLGLHRPHMPEDTFLHSVAHLFVDKHSIM